MSAIAKKVGRRVAGQRLAEYEPEDPHYGTSRAVLLVVNQCAESDARFATELQRSTPTPRAASVNGNEPCRLALANATSVSS